MNIPAAVLTEEEKVSIISAVNDQYKDSIRSRRVEAVLVYGVVFSGKDPFFSGWASGTAAHRGVVVDGYLNHLIFKLNEDRKPVGIMFESQIFLKNGLMKG